MSGTSPNYLNPDPPGPKGLLELRRLQVTYGRLGQAVATGHGMDEALAATLIMQLVESVIQLRRAGELRDGYGHQIAAACLRLAGLGTGEIARARAAAEDLFTAPDHRGHRDLSGSGRRGPR